MLTEAYLPWPALVEQYSCRSPGFAAYRCWRFILLHPLFSPMPREIYMLCLFSATFRSLCTPTFLHDFTHSCIKVLKQAFRHCCMPLYIHSSIHKLPIWYKFILSFYAGNAGVFMMSTFKIALIWVFFFVWMHSLMFTLIYDFFHTFLHSSISMWILAFFHVLTLSSTFDYMMHSCVHVSIYSLSTFISF